MPERNLWSRVTLNDLINHRFPIISRVFTCRLVRCIGEHVNQRSFNLKGDIIRQAMPDDQNLNLLPGLMDIPNTTQFLGQLILVLLELSIEVGKNAITLPLAHIKSLMVSRVTQTIDVGTKLLCRKVRKFRVRHNFYPLPHRRHQHPTRQPPNPVQLLHPAQPV